MPKYVDIENLNLRGLAVFDDDLDVLIPLSDLRKALQMLPAADVVPRATLDELFAELEKSVTSKIPPYIRLIFKDDRNFEDGFRDGKTDALIEVLMIIAELKKKYI